MKPPQNPVPSSSRVGAAGPGGTVEVEVRSGSPDKLAPELASARAVRIRVRDTGPGIPADAREHVFDPFYTRRPGGTGLGLALVQRAAEAHGGAVMVDQGAEGWGATFCLYLPALSAVGSVPAPPAPTEEAP